MSTPFVALVGRPNVGKSTLFNRIVGENMSVVDNRPGTTRDRVYAKCDWNGAEFTLVDTGGIEPLEALRDKSATVIAEASADFVVEIRQQAEVAISEADVIVFTVDGQAGLTAIDEAVADILRRLIGQRQKSKQSVPPIIVAASKSEATRVRQDAVEFYGLGLGEVFAVSGMQGDGVADLLDEVVRSLPNQQPIDESEDDSLKIAILGRPNVGKSSLFNQLIGEPRVIVSPVAGTTRDAIDTIIEFIENAHAIGNMNPTDIGTIGSVEKPNADDDYDDDDGEFEQDFADDDLDDYDETDFEDEDGEFEETEDTAANKTQLTGSGVNKITLIDTAGIRKRGSIEPGVEKFSVLRAFKAIERAHVVLLLVDADNGITVQDEHIAGYILEANKGVIVLVNKWDLIESKEKVARAEREVEGFGMLTEKMYKVLGEARSRFNFMSFAPVMFISAKTGFRCDQIFPAALRVNEARTMRISTADLNRILREAHVKHAPPSVGGRRLKVFFGSQVGINPPTFVFHCNDTKLAHFSYRRYIENRIRAEFGFFGTPIRIIFRGRGEKKI